jgi:hypothetical protein
MTAPSLAEFSLEVTKAAFLRARSFKITKAVGLSVYRSVWLGETDEWCDPIYEALGMFKHHEVHREVRHDPMMMHGRAELRVYALGETEQEVKANSGIIRDMVELVQSEIA